MSIIWKTELKTITYSSTILMRTNRIKTLHKIAEQTIMEPIVMRVLQHLCKEDHTQEAQRNRIADRTTVRGISNQQPLSHLQ